jgi:glycosyltransferase involved in cell wall biosynthesis
VAQPRAITVIPNCIDLEEFAPSPDLSAEQPATLVFTGTMDFRPNVDAVTWFAREVWPLIRQGKPQAQFVIVGRRPSPAVQALKSLPGISVTGAVPDARPYIRQSAIYVVPMRMGGGVRYKVLEAMAMGKAVVSTTFGADGIPLVPDRDALLADSPADFAQAVLTLLDDPARRAVLAANGRAFVEAHFDWRKMLSRLDTVLISPNGQ